MTTPSIQTPTSMLRFCTCGSVDDGKSTLMGRLLYELGVVPDDQISAISSRGVPGIDFSLLFDGLAAEREQGITIDVAYRYFTARGRRYIIADAPGHEQYTRNMATAASTAQAAVILIDARKGILPQTRRHALILAKMGVRSAVLAVNKIDLIAYDEREFNRISGEFADVADRLGLNFSTAIPTSGIEGSNVLSRSEKTAWYRGPTLFEWLDAASTDAPGTGNAFRLPVQWVNRMAGDFRGLAGLITRGKVSVGDPVRLARTGQCTRVARIITFSGDLSTAKCGQSITLVVSDNLDVGRGDVFTDPAHPMTYVDQFNADVISFSATPFVPHRSYIMRSATSLIPIEITQLKYRIDPVTLEHAAAHTLNLNEIACCNLSTAQPVAFDPYREDRETGSFILIDKVTRETAGIGLINHPLSRASNITRQNFTITRQTRASQKHQNAAVIWFTGLSGAGKSTIANLLEQRLFSLGRHTYLLDGDNLRLGLTKDLGFTEPDRVENVRRAAEVAKLMADAGLIVLVSLISPFEKDREMARDIAAPMDFVEVFVDAPIEVCEQRDPRGLYAKARSGFLKNFTGLDSPYEAPRQPEVHVRTDMQTPADAVEAVLDALMTKGLA